MDTFGVIFALPIAVIISIFYPRFVLKIFSKNQKWLVVACTFSCIVVAAILVEVGLIAKLGIMTAHDQYRPLLDSLQGYNSLLGPAAITNLTVAALFCKQFSSGLIKWVSGLVCFVAIVAMGISTLFYDDAAHYRTDKEGTYRIQE